MFLDWMPGVLRDAGVDVYMMPGCERRSTWASGLRTVRGIVWHHTATGPSWADGHVAALLRDGRRDLSGPLSQVGVERDGTWVIVALGRANHNGWGQWGNDSLGLEFYNAGTGRDPWPGAQVASGVRGIAACLNYMGKSQSYCRGHKETDPTRKIDPAGLNMDQMRVRIAAAQINLQLQKEIDMGVMIDVNDVIDRQYLEAWGRKPDVSGFVNWAAHIGFASDGADFKNRVNDLRRGLGLKLVG